MFTTGAEKSGGMPGLSFIAAGMKATGDLETDGVIKIEGTVDGTIRARGQVLVARGGLVVGDIHAGECVIGGEVRGSVVAGGRAEIQDGALVRGDLTTPRLQVHEGGEIEGQVRMGSPLPAKVSNEPAGALLVMTAS